ncbi:MAG: family transcriptional regulator, dissimilatory nitrate respiration regulator [Thermotogaceae bacterium]|nr:family transcriptional regulator, dissimilatory nitrate respiration regulator [Thermotogaceae bacterium]
MNPLVASLARLDLFENITLGELEKILQSSNGVMLSYQPGETIKFKGEECSELLILLTGEVQAQMQNEEGKVMVVENIKSPSVLASAFLFSSKNFYPVDIIAKDKVKILSFSKEKVLEICQQNRKFLLNLLRNMGDRVTFLSEKLYLFSLSDLKERIARYLFQISNGNKQLKLPTTKEELSKIFGVTRPSLSRAFSQLEKEGLIEQLSDGKIVIKDPKGLKKLIKD